jgi:hypothetical protein
VKQTASRAAARERLAPIAPMREPSFAKGMLAAIKADTSSLTAWQVGMYGVMAIAYFVFIQRAFGTKLEVTI